MTDTITIRPAIAEDAYRAQELRKLGWRDNYVYPEGGVTLQVISDRLAILPPSRADIDYFEETIKKPQNHHMPLVAELNGEVVGVVFYETLENGNGDIGVFVDRKHRGQKIGSKLLAELIARTTNTLEVTIFALNQSKNLYVQHGFVEVGEQAIHHFDETTYLPIQRLILRRN